MTRSQAHTYASQLVACGATRVEIMRLTAGTKDHCVFASFERPQWTLRTSEEEESRGCESYLFQTVEQVQRWIASEESARVQKESL